MGRTRRLDATRTRRVPRRRSWGFAIAVVAVTSAACDAISPVPSSSPPVNACSNSSCAEYVQLGAKPSCTDGVCTVQAMPTNVLLVIGLPADSVLGPGRTYLTTLERAGSASRGGPCALPDCSGTTCQLPEIVADSNWHLIDPNAAEQVGWNLGNPGNPTALPVQATYRRRLYVGPSTADALDLGLPVPPVQGLNVTTRVYNGPNGDAPLAYQASMQPGCYERTLQPFSPLSRAFPPEIKPWTPADGALDRVGNFDVTREETLVPMGRTVIVPTFEIGRAEGLDGWTAYLRNATTKRIFSNVAPLAGSLAQNVVLATNYLTDAAMPDALTGLELVLEPPHGAPIPTEAIAPQGLPPVQGLAAHESYPTLPLPVTLTGRTTLTSTGDRVAAELIFTATAIFDRSGKPFPPNFAFETRAHTTTDPRTGASTYSVILPQGEYAIAVRPDSLGAALGMTAGAVTATTRIVGGSAISSTTTPSPDMAVDPLVPVGGYAIFADNRPLYGATVEAVPTGCAGSTTSSFDASSTQAIAVSPVSDACLPRPAQTITKNDGSFVLELDPGGYLLRVRPVEGSRLPWVKQNLVVNPGSPPFALREAIWVPAPIRIDMTLTDSAGGDTQGGNTIANAIVRAFSDPTGGEAPVELGRAITDSAGKFELVLAPPPAQ